MSVVTFRSLGGRRRKGDGERSEPCPTTCRPIGGVACARAFVDVVGRARRAAMASIGRLGLLLVAALAAAGVAGCAHPPPPRVQPWQREYLARRALRFDADPL